MPNARLLQSWRRRWRLARSSCLSRQAPLVVAHLGVAASIIDRLPVAGQARRTRCEC
jgi:hypothetical protein